MSLKTKLFRIKEVFYVIGLLAIVVFLWALIYDRFNLSVPVAIDGDTNYSLAMMRLSQNGDLGLFRHIKTKALGAPFEGSLNDFPQNERFIMWTGGLIARVMGLYKAANLMVIGLHLLAAASFYYASRLLRLPIWTALPLAIVYSMSHQTVRGLPHIGVGYFGLLPLQLYCCWYISNTPKISLKSRRFKLCAVIGTPSGLMSFYWVVFFIQIYVISVAYRFLKKRRFVLFSIVPLALSIIITFLLLASFGIYQVKNGRNRDAIIRHYYDLEYHTLNPMDLIIPNKDQAFGLFNEIYQDYEKDSPIRLGESSTVYIGLMGIFGLLILLIKSVRRHLLGKNLPPGAWGILWVLAYSSFGGLNSIFGLITHIYLIRSTNRYSIVIGTIGLLYFSIFLHRILRGRSNLIKISSVWVLSVFAIVDQKYYHIYFC